MQKLPMVGSGRYSPGEIGPANRRGYEHEATAAVEPAQLFRALGDSTRLAILQQLRAHEEVCACAFVACCDVAQPTVSHHLKVLREAGLISANKRGVWMYYRLNTGALERARGFIP